MLDAAEALLREKSFEDVRVADIAERAHSSVAGFYRRFKDKDGLLHALHERHCEESFATADDALHPARWQNAGIQEILSSVFPFVIEILKRDETLERAIFQRALSDGSMRERAGRLRRHVMRGVAELLSARSQEIRHPNPPLAISFAIVQAGALLTEYYTVGVREIELVPTSDHEIAEELTHACCRYLGVSSRRE
jgi:AcrR family transcriptional regulator